MNTAVPKFVRVDVMLAMSLIVLVAAIGWLPLTLVGGFVVSMLTTGRWTRSGLTMNRALFGFGVIVGMWFTAGVAGLCLRAGLLLGNLLGIAVALALLVVGAWAISRFVNLRWHLFS